MNVRSGNWHIRHEILVRDVGELPEDYGRSLEMSGRQASVIVRYGANSPGLTVFFPYYHTGRGPGDSIRHDCRPNIAVRLSSGQETGLARVSRVAFDGVFSAEYAADFPISASVRVLPASRKPAAIAVYALENTSSSTLRGRVLLRAAEDRTIETLEAGRVTLVESLLFRAGLSRDIDFELSPGASIEFGWVVQVCKADPEPLNLESELRARSELVDVAASRAEFASEHEELDLIFRLAKLRAVESVFDTEIGPMHSPGGESYYGGIWCNDQAEYAFPLFPYLGLDNDVALHDYLLLAERRMESGQLPYSVESAGHFLWHARARRLRNVRVRRIEVPAWTR